MWGKLGPEQQQHTNKERRTEKLKATSRWEYVQESRTVVEEIPRYDG